MGYFCLIPSKNYLFNALDQFKMTRTHSPIYELSAIKPRRSLNTGDHVLLTEICYNNFLLC